MSEMYEVEFRCLYCKKCLTSDQVFCNSGICSWCGEEAHGSSPMCDISKHPYKLMMSSTGWWIFKKATYRRVYKSETTEPDNLTGEN